MRDNHRVNGIELRRGVAIAAGCGFALLIAEALYIVVTQPNQVLFLVAFGFLPLGAGALAGAAGFAVTSLLYRRRERLWSRGTWLSASATSAVVAISVAWILRFNLPRPLLWWLGTGIGFLIVGLVAFANRRSDFRATSGAERRRSAFELPDPY